MKNKLNVNSHVPEVQENWRTNKTTCVMSTCKKSTFFVLQTNQPSQQKLTTHMNIAKTYQNTFHTKQHVAEGYDQF